MPYLEPTEEKMIALYRMAEIMRTSVPNLRVPLEASPELGDNWASTKEVSERIDCWKPSHHHKESPNCLKMESRQKKSKLNPANSVLAPGSSHT